MENYNDEIRVLGFPDAIRKRPGMYVGDVTDATQLLMELIGNIEDEISNYDYCNKAVIDQNWNGWVLCMDSGHGIPLELSKDIPNQSSMEVALTNIHAGSKFEATDKVRIGMNGCGLKACVSLSEEFIMMSRITSDNYNKSVPLVEETWNKYGPRSKKDLYYVLGYKKGIKIYEVAGKLDDIEKDIFGSLGQYDQLPRGFSTIAMLKPDPEIFDSTETKLPVKSLQYFLLIQEKLYHKKIELLVNKEFMNGTFQPYKFEFLKTIIPANTEKNKSVTVYVTFEVDPELGQKQECGSVAGLQTDQGVHIDYVRSCYEIALKEFFKIKHKYLSNGLRLCVVLIAEDLVFNSQNKERLKAISKVKLSDFAEVAKEFQKIFKNNLEYWQEHVAKLDFFAQSMRSLSSEEKINKMIEESQGNAYYKTKNSIVEGYAAATAGPNDRWDCELFLCFTGDTEILTCNNEHISFVDLVKRIENGENIYTFSCTEDGVIKPAKIIAAKKIKQSSKITTVILDNGEKFRCTPDHRIMMLDGTYKEASLLNPGDSLMPLYMKEIEDISTDEDYKNNPVFHRRVVSSKRVVDTYGRSYKALDSEHNDYYVYRIMASHPDTKRHESLDNLKEGDTITRHHIDHNPLNDYPTNLSWCSSRWHRAHHGVMALHEKAKQDSEFYDRMYINSKRTPEYSELKSKLMTEYYNTEVGQNMKENLREKANKEWEDEDLRKWRAEETKRYAAEHPEWIKSNVEKKNKLLSEKIFKEVNKFIEDNNLEKSSYEFNKTVLLWKLNGTVKHTYQYFEFVKDKNLDLVKNYTISDINDPLEISAKLILESLKEQGKCVTVSTFNEEAKKFFNSDKIVNGKGYLSLKRKFPSLFEQYEHDLNKNHKVLSVVTEDCIEDVYCLEVDTPEHNFPLAAGIFVKNCEGLSPFGSLKNSRLDIKHQACLALRGKPKGLARYSDYDKGVESLLDNREYFSIFKLIGLGVGKTSVINGCKTEEEAYERVRKFARYGSIIISTDSDQDGLSIRAGLLYTFSRFARFMIDFKMIKIAESPVYIQDGKFFYPSDPCIPGTDFPIGLDTTKPFKHIKGLGSLNKDEASLSFFDKSTRKLITVTTEGIDYSMGLVEDINNRRQLLINNGILTNPYNFNDVW